MSEAVQDYVGEQRTLIVPPPPFLPGMELVCYTVTDGGFYASSWTFDDLAEAVDKYLARGLEQATLTVRAVSEFMAQDIDEAIERVDSTSVYDPGLLAWGNWE